MQFSLILFTIIVGLITLLGIIGSAAKIGSGEKAGCSLFLTVCFFVWTVINIVLLITQ
jgi:hypothetical protein